MKHLKYLAVLMVIFFIAVNFSQACDLKTISFTSSIGCEVDILVCVDCGDETYFGGVTVVNWSPRCVLTPEEFILVMNEVNQYVWTESAFRQMCRAEIPPCTSPLTYTVDIPACYEFSYIDEFGDEVWVPCGSGICRLTKTLCWNGQEYESSETSFWSVPPTCNYPDPLIDPSVQGCIRVDTPCN